MTRSMIAGSIPLLFSAVVLAACGDAPTMPTQSTPDDPSELAVPPLRHFPTLPPEKRGDLYIETVLFFTPNDPTNNCVIISTRGEEAVDVSGYIVASERTRFRLPEGTVVPVGEPLVVHWNNSGTTTPSDVWTGPGLGDFSPNEDEVILLSPRHLPWLPSLPRDVVDYIQWDRDRHFGNEGASRIRSLELLAVLARLWDGSSVPTDIGEPVMKIVRTNGGDGPGVTAADYMAMGG